MSDVFYFVQYKRLLDDSEANKRDLEKELDEAVAQKENALRQRRPSLSQRSACTPTSSVLPGNSTDRDKVGAHLFQYLHDIRYTLWWDRGH